MPSQKFSIFCNFVQYKAWTLCVYTGLAAGGKLPLVEDSCCLRNPASASASLEICFQDINWLECRQED